MAKYPMPDGTVVDTENATRNWVGSEEDELLYRSRRGRFYLVHRSRASDAWAEWLSPERTAAWLMVNKHELPEELVDAAARVTE